MTTTYKKKAKSKKYTSTDSLIKGCIVFTPVIFFLMVYFLAGFVFDYTSTRYSRLQYNEKVNGLLNAVQERILNKEPQHDEKVLVGER